MTNKGSRKNVARIVDLLPTHKIVMKGGQLIL